jgi:hypothetical protein
MWDYFQGNPTWALSGAARTNFVPENSYTSATAVAKKHAMKIHYAKIHLILQALKAA